MTRRSDHCCSHRPLLAVVGGRLPKRCPSCCKCEESYGTSLRGLPQSFDASIALGWAIDRYFSPCHDPLPPPVLPVGAHAQTVDSAPEPTIVPRAVLYRLGSSKDGRKEQDRHTHIQAGVPAAKKYPAPHLPLSRPRQLGRGGGCSCHAWSDTSRMTIDPRIRTMPGRSTPGFYRPGGHCLLAPGANSGRPTHCHAWP